MSSFVDFYEVLGIGPDADAAAIRRAYLVLAKANHPDAGGSTEKMQQLNVAYRTLTNPSAKAAYDMVYGYQHGTIAPGEFDYTNAYFTRDITDMSDDEIDDYLDTLFAEYHYAAPKAKQGFSQWFSSFWSKA
jgi:curved DNA-binding protein CbpA